MSEVSVTQEFIEENQKQKLSQEKKSGGPYSKKERQKRQSEVFRLHFELGYSARKISDMMQVNRHTIDNDINQIYSQLGAEWDSYSLESWSMKQTLRMESQRTRLLERLDKTNNFQERVAVERMILEIDSRLMNMVQKVMNSRESMVNTIIDSLNKFAKENKLNLGYVHYNDVVQLSNRKSTEKILKLIKEDKQRKIGRI